MPQKNKTIIELFNENKEKILTNYRLSDSLILPEEGWQKIEDVPYILNANEKESMWPRERSPLYKGCNFVADK